MDTITETVMAEPDLPEGRLVPAAIQPVSVAIGRGSDCKWSVEKLMCRGENRSSTLCDGEVALLRQICRMKGQVFVSMSMRFPKISTKGYNSFFREKIYSFPSAVEYPAGTGLVFREWIPRSRHRKGHYSGRELKGTVISVSVPGESEFFITVVKKD